MGRDSAVGIVTGYMLEGPGIEFLPIPVAERSKARVCGRSLLGLRVRILSGAWMFVLCVASADKKGKMQDNQDRKTGKDEAQTEYKRIKEFPGEGGGFPHPSRPALRSTKPPIQWVLGPCSGVKAVGAWR